MVYGSLRYFLGLERISRYDLAVRVEEKKNISAAVLVILSITVERRYLKVTVLLYFRDL